MGSVRVETNWPTKALGNIVGYSAFRAMAQQFRQVQHPTGYKFVYIVKESKTRAVKPRRPKLA